MITSETPGPEERIAVVGGGIIGTCLAWRLAQAGWTVSIFEKSFIGGEASWAGAGMLSIGGEVENASPLATLAIESLRLYGPFVRELEALSGLAIDYQDCGGLDLAYSPAEAQELEARARRQAEIGIESKPVSPEQIRQFWPRIQNVGLVGGRFYPDDAIVNPREMVTALASACRKSNVRVQQNCPVEGVAVSASAIEVETATGTESYAAAIIAAGAWSDLIRVNGVRALPLVEPVRGHLLGYQQPSQTCNTIVRHGETYFLQRANGLLIVGSSLEHVGFDRQIDANVTGSLARRAAFVFPHLGETTPSEVWNGFRPASDDIHIGSWDSKRLYLAYGHYRNGILLAPVTANRIAAEISANLGTRQIAAGAYRQSR